MSRWLVPRQTFLNCAVIVNVLFLLTRDSLLWWNINQNKRLLQVCLQFRAKLDGEQKMLTLKYVIWPVCGPLGSTVLRPECICDINTWLKYLSTCLYIYFLNTSEIQGTSIIYGSILEFRQSYNSLLRGLRLQRSRVQALGRSHYRTSQIWCDPFDEVNCGETKPPKFPLK